MINTSSPFKPHVGPATFAVNTPANGNASSEPKDSFRACQPTPDFAGQAQKLADLARDLQSVGGMDAAAHAAINHQLNMLRHQQELYRQAQAQGKLTCPPAKTEAPSSPQVLLEQMHNQNRVLNSLVNYGPQAALTQQGLIMQELGSRQAGKSLDICSALSQQQKFNRLNNARQMGDLGGQLAAGTDIINTLAAGSR